MSKNCGRTAQGKREAAGQQFPVQHQIFRQTVEDQVQVDFTNHAYVQCRHDSPLLLAWHPGIDFTEVRSRLSISPSLDRCSEIFIFTFAGLLYWTNERKRYKEK